ncbi:transporter substrate-binding domain-containing protein [Rouxiella badensis]|uniref:transporter substrate-binding domain-containing protein n=2 Tax=Gammaproteobacteria TaxID=1236 RepID=UPI000E4C0CE7|nr:MULTISPECIES: transporter substrate-binding domain-containing protein [Enterobacterales]MBU9814952.1 transporter substrate-binding domain-containing protein [Rahnella perminowiae]AXU94807.1 ABC transporter substrate-binding protein [Erwinia persicina]MBU9827908.1 transporter substrate-binding domain-containing protein [Rahnella perminowiae]MBU9867538.1 transporter substrate-binding domain-containing protein [Rahnella aceris]MCC3721034.1 transporter substrate-binding domain-containing protei
MLTKKNWFRVFVLVTLSPVVFASQPALRFGVDLTYPPFQSTDKTGHPAGFEIDVTDALCKSIDAKCDYVINTFDAQIPALLAKKIDVISPLGVTPKRMKAIDFSNYVFHVPTQLVARKSANLLPQSDVLKGKIIAVQQGSIQEAYANKYWLQAGVNIKSYPDQDAIYQDLYAGRVDGALSPSVGIMFGFLQTPEGKDFELKGPEVTDADLFSAGSAYGIRKNDEQTRKLINQGLQNIIKNGMYEKIKKRYFGDLDLSVKNG